MVFIIFLVTMCVQPVITSTIIVLMAVAMTIGPISALMMSK